MAEAVLGAFQPSQEPFPWPLPPSRGQGAASRLLPHLLPVPPHPRHAGRSLACSSRALSTCSYRWKASRPPGAAAVLWGAGPLPRAGFLPACAPGSLGARLPWASPILETSVCHLPARRGKVYFPGAQEAKGISQVLSTSQAPSPWPQRRELLEGP